MKFTQCAVIGFLLTLSEAAQTPATQTTTPSSQTAPPAASPATPAKPMVLTTPDGGETVKGPEHPITLDQMKELYVDMGYQKTLDDNRTQMITMQKARMPFMPEDVWDDLDTSSKNVDYPAAFLSVYKKYISTEDATKLIEFAKTPAGKAFFDNLPAITRETGTAIQKEQMEVNTGVRGRHKDEIDTAIKKYQDEQKQKAAAAAAASKPATGSTGAAGSTAPGASTTKPATPPATSTPATPPANTPPNN
jgi:hypothetical protein